MDEKQTILRINWRKMPLGVLAMLSLVAVPVTLVLGVANVINFAWFFLAIAVGAVSVGALRFIAVSQQHKKYGYHPVSTIHVDTPKQVPGLVALKGKNAPFDASEKNTADDGVDAVTEESVEEPAGTAVQETVAPAKTVDTEKTTKNTAKKTTGVASDSWEPVDVPEPSYLKSPKVEREEPEPLELPEQPQSTINRLKETLVEQEPVESSSEDDDLEAQQRTVHKTVRANQAKPGALNLDDVLDRRRA